mgnify:CR=1 FL=1
MRRYAAGHIADELLVPVVGLARGASIRLAVLGLALATAVPFASGQGCSASAPSVTILGGNHARISGTYSVPLGSPCFLEGNLTQGCIGDCTSRVYHGIVNCNTDGYVFNILWRNNGGPPFGHIATTGFVPSCSLSAASVNAFRRVQKFIRDLPPQPQFYLRERAVVLGVRGVNPGEVVLTRNLPPGQIGRWSMVVPGTGAAAIQDGATPWGSMRSGSQTRELTISSMTEQDEGLYLFHAGTAEPLPMVDSVNVYFDRPLATILSMPQDREACEGGDSRFTVRASGDGLSYRWYRDGLPMSNGAQTSVGIAITAGATTEELLLSGVDASAGGQYHCVVTAAGFGAVPHPTFPARLLVNANTVAPAMLAMPESISAAIGSRAEFTADVDAPDGQMPALQWRRNGVPIYDDGRIEGAETEQLVINWVVEGDSASYDCIITRGCASMTTDPATLTIDQGTPCPADFNQDGGIDGADVDAFFVAWEGGLGSADVNADGGVDGADVDTFFAAWEAGGCG